MSMNRLALGTLLCEMLMVLTDEALGHDNYPLGKDA